jgi:hypothetical protein
LPPIGARHQQFNVTLRRELAHSEMVQRSDYGWEWPLENFLDVDL